MFFPALLFSIFLVQIKPQFSDQQAVNVKPCKNQKEFKWVVSIQRDGKHACNGVIMENKAIFTTALCCQEKLRCSSEGPNEHLRVIYQYGAESEMTLNENNMIAEVDRCIIHPSYQREKDFVEHDNAILVLRNDLPSDIPKPAFVEGENLLQEYAKMCPKGMVSGWWFHDHQRISYSLECFPVTITELQKCAEASSSVQLKNKKNISLTCSIDTSHHDEVCSAFYGAPLTCNGKVVALVSHKFNFVEECVEFPQFYYARIDWSEQFRKNFSKGLYGRSLPDDYYLWSDADSSRNKYLYIMYILFALYNIYVM